MKIKRLPFNIDFLADIPNTYAGMLPVQTGQLYEGRHGDYHPQGLYSNVVFGKQGEEARDEKEGFINLKVPVFHPLYYKELIALKQLYNEILTRQAYAVFDEAENDFVRSDIMTGETGFAFFLRHFPKLIFKRNKSQQRDLRIDLLEKYRQQAFVKRIIVIPAGLRDIELTEEGQPKEEEINDLYRKVISVSNTINVDFESRNSELLDEAKASMQRHITAIYDYIFQMLEGKKGLLQGKFASRRIVGSTRNVLSSMDVGSEVLGDERQPGLNTTMVGLFQFMKATQIHLTEYAFRSLFLSDMYAEGEYEVPLVDRKTLKTVYHSLSDKVREKWLTSDGLENMINGFADATLRHRPVTIDGHFLRLIYQDDKYYKIMKSIDELPDGWEPANVRPMSWAEMYYLLSKDLVPRSRAFCTRYPVTGLSSIYASEVYIKTTVSGLNLLELDESWAPTDNRAVEFPDTSNNLAFFDTMSVSPYMLSGLGAD
ncbi:hypothetical protein [Vibrio phage vB_VmeM-Yong XC32]|nr:hypothetical protein [Vibrio phage vB_VmeM-Yong XC31]QAX96450.1 hypothetical protein [Vibrio phage vB_VmeM-Yong XC32]QAX96767.1 hypothetical protein [Vibrio phage vB_VmeM-Yong MS31]QAX97086.1 hypothetical protein [Vibrio phage vB_VmeM-Yong MS32]